MGMKKLRKQYRESLKIVRALQLKANFEDREHLESMTSDLQYAIEWMQTGRRPGNKRGIERRAAYQREVLTDDPLKYQKYFIASVIGQAGSITESERERIEAVLQCLSKLEREVFLMARGQCLSRSEIARLLRVEKGTVNNILTRADKKLLKHKKICRPFATYM